jgi:RHS repeat-associated protein
MNLRFPGQYADSETGLFYNYFRSYQPNQGRYTQNDPIGLGGGWNRFGYVEGNPLRHPDPFGLQKTVDQMMEREQVPGTRPDYPITPRRPVLPPLPPPPDEPPVPDPWPGADDWRGQCSRLYAQCVRDRWTGSCNACMHKCTAQQEWPFSGPVSCRPKRKKGGNMCSLDD